MESAYVAILSILFFSLYYHRLRGGQWPQQQNQWQEQEQEQAAPTEPSRHPGPGPPPPPGEADARGARAPRCVLRAGVLPPARLTRRRGGVLRGARQGVLHRARRDLREPPALPLAAAHLLRRHHAPDVQLRPALAQPPPHRHGSAPVRAPRRLQHVPRHLRRGARDGAQDVPCRRGRPRRRREGGAEAQAVRGLPQHPDGDHRADEDVPCRGGRRRHGHVAGGPGVEEGAGRVHSPDRRGQHVGPLAGAEVVRRVRREEEDRGRGGQKGRVPAAAHRRGAKQPRRRRRERQEEHDFRSALPAEVGAGGVHGYRDHGSLLEHVHRGHGDDGDRGGMGHVAAAEPPGGSEESAGRDRRLRRALPPARRRRPAAPGLPPVRRQRDAPAVPGCADADPARVRRGLRGRRPPRARRHDAARQRARHPQGPGGVDGPGRVPARAVRGRRRRWPAADAVRDGAAQVPR